MSSSSRLCGSASAAIAAPACRAGRLGSGLTSGVLEPASSLTSSLRKGGPRLQVSTVPHPPSQSKHTNQPLRGRRGRNASETTGGGRGGRHSQKKNAPPPPPPASHIPSPLTACPRSPAPWPPPHPAGSPPGHASRWPPPPPAARDRPRAAAASLQRGASRQQVSSQGSFHSGVSMHTCPAESGSPPSRGRSSSQPPLPHSTHAPPSLPTRVRRQRGAERRVGQGGVDAVV
jgi:hypothetical protein